MKSTRTSTKFTVYAGIALVVAAIACVVGGFIVGAITSVNIVEVIYALLLASASYLGINNFRIAAENIATINTAKTASTSPTVEGVEVQATGQGVKVSPSSQDGQEGAS